MINPLRDKKSSLGKMPSRPFPLYCGGKVVKNEIAIQNAFMMFSFDDMVVGVNKNRFELKSKNPAYLLPYSLNDGIPSERRPSHGDCENPIPRYIKAFSPRPFDKNSSHLQCYGYCGKPLTPGALSINCGKNSQASSCRGCAKIGIPPATRISSTACIGENLTRGIYPGFPGIKRVENAAPGEENSPFFVKAAAICGRPMVPSAVSAKTSFISGDNRGGNHLYHFLHSFNSGLGKIL